MIVSGRIKTDTQVFGTLTGASPWSRKPGCGSVRAESEQIQVQVRWYPVSSRNWVLTQQVMETHLLLMDLSLYFFQLSLDLTENERLFLYLSWHPLSLTVLHTSKQAHVDVHMHIYIYICIIWYNKSDSLYICNHQFIQVSYLNCYLY
jgi:hypothetical protein